MNTKYVFTFVLIINLAPGILPAKSAPSIETTPQ
jgi:hypothetical protein